VLVPKLLFGNALVLEAPLQFSKSIYARCARSQTPVWERTCFEAPLQFSKFF